MNTTLEVYFESQGGVDLRDALRGRGDTFEPGLSIVDTDLPIAGAGTVDWVALDAQRNLVIADIEGAAPDDVFARVRSHAEWFAANSAIVRRMYQVWNVNWETPIRTLCVFGSEHRRTLHERGFHPKIDRGAVAIEMIVAQIVRARDGREAIVLSAFGETRAATQRSESPPESDREADPQVHSARDYSSPAVVIQPAERVFSRNTTKGGKQGSRSQTVMHAGQERVLSRDEAYRRELGLTHEEFSEFFEGPSAP